MYSLTADTAIANLSGICPTTLQAQSQQWIAWQRESEQLQGRQVMAVAAALQALTRQLEW